MIESFEDARIFAQVIMSDCDAPIISRLQGAHEHEIEQLRRSRFREGYEAGQRSMDAEHYAVALRLKHLPLDEDSHGNLSQIARAIWHSDFGWTRGACEALRDELVRLLGGVHEIESGGAASCACDAGCDCGCEQPQAVAYDVLGNERHKAVCELKKIHTDAGGFVKALANALGVEWQAPRVHQTIAEVRDRLIHLLGGDTEPTSQESPILSNCATDDGGEVTITDELREYVSDHILKDIVLTTYPEQHEVHGVFEDFIAFADRIDEQVEELAHDTVMWRDRAEDMRMERDGLRKSLRKIAEHVGVQHDLELSTYDDDTVAKATVQLVGMMHKHIKTLEEKLDTIREALDG